MFTSKELVRVFVEDDPENVILILPKMSFGVRQWVRNTLASLPEDPNKPALGLYEIALMRHNIVGWEGPAFEGIPCTPEAIENLDQDEPLVDRVLLEIINRNLMKRSPRGNFLTASTPMSAGGASSQDGANSR